MIVTILAAAAVSGQLRSTPDLGVAAGRCRPGEAGPALIVDVEGLRDRRGLLKLEVYPANDTDFLADDNVLVAAGKTFRRVVTPLPANGPVSLCVRVPGPGRYAVSLLHDRDGNRRFNLSSDGIGFAGNPKLGLSKPAAASASTLASARPVRIGIVMNYRHGLFSFRPDASR